VKQKHHEENFFKTEERHKGAGEVRQTNSAKELKDFKVRNTKARQAFDARYATVQRKYDESNVPSAKLTRAMSDTVHPVTGCLSRPEYHHMVETNKTMVDLCEHNRKLLSRSHSYHQEQELERIAGMRDKVKVMLDARVRAGQRRMSMIKNCAIEKHHLADRVDRVKSASSGKMNKILADLDPEPEAGARINELLSAMGMDLLPGTKVDEEEK